MAPIELKKDFKNRYVAFLDVLGFSELVFSNNIDLLESYFNTIQSLITDLSLKLSNIEFLLISDSIVLITDDEKENFIALLICIQEIQSKLLARGIILRGGVSFGEVYFKNGVLVGKGFIKAYDLEKHANVPRVIIDPFIITKIGGNKVNFESEINYLGKPSFANRRQVPLIRKEFNGNLLIDFDAIEIDYCSKFLYDAFDNPDGIVISENLIVFLTTRLYDKQDHYKKYKWLKQTLQNAVSYSFPGENSNAFLDHVRGPLNRL